MSGCGRQIPASRGTVLVAVMVITTMAAMAAATLMFRIRAEVTASAAGANGEQAFAAAMSGIQQTLDLLGRPADQTGGWYDNPDRLRNQLVWDDGINRWYFTIYAHNPEDREQFRYGVTDEAGKININIADADMLLGLPNMTEELVDCLMDFRDIDETPRTNGAEQDYYDQLPFPYRIKNAPFATLEEVLLVKGFNGTVVFGEDANLNGLLDANEDDGEDTFPPDDADGELNRGLRAAATTISYDPDLRGDGQSRLNINGGLRDLGRLGRIGLSRQTVEFIQVYRAEGNLFKHPSELLGMKYKVKGAASRYRSLRHIRAGSTISSGVGRDNLAVVMDGLTTKPSGRMPLVGMISVNAAPVHVLAALPGLDEEVGERIVDARSGLDEQMLSTVAWLYIEDIVDAETFKAVAPRLTARGYQFRIQCVGFGVPCGRFRVVEVVVDIAGSTPRITYLRDITRLGLPAAIDAEEQEL